MERQPQNRPSNYLEAQALAEKRIAEEQAAQAQAEASAQAELHRQAARNKAELDRVARDEQARLKEQEAAARHQERIDARHESAPMHDDAAELRIFGSRGRTYVDPDSGAELPPVAGKLEELRNPGAGKYGHGDRARDLANADADAYLSKIRFYTEGPANLSLAQAELVVEGELEDQQMARAIAADLQGLGKDEKEAATIAKEYAERQSKLRQTAVKEEAVYTKEQMAEVGVQRLLDRTVETVSKAISRDQETLAKRKEEQRKLEDARDQDRQDIIKLSKSFEDAGLSPSEARHKAERAMQRKEDDRFSDRAERIRETAVKALMAGKNGTRLSRADAEKQYDAANPRKSKDTNDGDLTFLEPYKAEKVSYITEPAAPARTPKPKRKAPVPVPAPTDDDSGPKPPTPPAPPTPPVPVSPAPTPPAAEAAPIVPAPDPAEAIPLPPVPPAAEATPKPDFADPEEFTLPPAPIVPPRPVRGSESAADTGEIYRTVAGGEVFRDHAAEKRKSTDEQIAEADALLLESDKISHNDVLKSMKLLADSNDSMRAIKWKELHHNAGIKARDIGGLSNSKHKDLIALTDKLDAQAQVMVDGVSMGYGTFILNRYSEQGQYQETGEALSKNAYRLVEAIFTGNAKNIAKYSKKMEMEDTGDNFKPSIKSYAEKKSLGTSRAEALLDRFGDASAAARNYNGEEVRRGRVNRAARAIGSFATRRLSSPSRTALDVSEALARRGSAKTRKGSATMAELAARTAGETTDEPSTPGELFASLGGAALGGRPATPRRARGGTTPGVRPVDNPWATLEPWSAAPERTPGPSPVYYDLDTDKGGVRIPLSEPAPPVRPRPVAPVPVPAPAPAAERPAASVQPDPLSAAETAEIPRVNDDAVIAPRGPEAGQANDPMLVTNEAFNAMDSNERAAYSANAQRFYAENPDALEQELRAIDTATDQEITAEFRRLASALPVGSEAHKRLLERQRPLFRSSQTTPGRPRVRPVRGEQSSASAIPDSANQV